jgi:hypothetical protein
VNSTAYFQRISHKIDFIYYGKTITEIDILPGGDFFLVDQMQMRYHILPYHIENVANGMFYFNLVKSADDLNWLTYKFRAVSTNNDEFIATRAYTITYAVNIGNNFYQVVLCTDMKQTSFMIVSYAMLYDPPDYTCCYFIDGDWQANIFQASLNNTNSKVPGQFIFQFNTIIPQKNTIMFFDNSLQYNEKKINLQFIYFGEKIVFSYICAYGDFYLMTNTSSYHIMTYHNIQYEPCVSFSQFTSNITDMSTLNGLIYSAYNTYVDITTAYAITWFGQNLLYQVILVQEMYSSFMIVSYFALEPGDTSWFYYEDTAFQRNTIMRSLNDTNCGVPGRFIFQLNTLAAGNG